MEGTMSLSTLYVDPSRVELEGEKPYNDYLVFFTLAVALFLLSAFFRCIIRRRCRAKTSGDVILPDATTVELMLPQEVEVEEPPPSYDDVTNDPPPPPYSQVLEVGKFLV